MPIHELIIIGIVFLLILIDYVTEIEPDNLYEVDIESP
jgi:hypothetical protein